TERTTVRCSSTLSRSRNDESRPPALPVHRLELLEALDAATGSPLGEKLRRYEAICGPRRSCRCKRSKEIRAEWRFCLDCLTVYDDYLKTSEPESANSM